MKLTERQALWLCREHWRWVEENPGVDKDDYFIGLPTSAWPNSTCYCCEYDMQNNMDWPHTCGFCLLKGYAWMEDCQGFSDYSYFRKWELLNDLQHHTYDQSFFAALMVDACNEALADLAAKP